MSTSVQNELFSLLFASGVPLSEDDLVRYTSVRKNKLHEELKALSERLEDLPVQLMQEQNGKWKLTLKQDYVPVVRHLNAETELPKGALAILGLIAQTGSALQSEIVNRIGSHAYDHIRQLVDQGFVEKTPEGRSYRLELGATFYRYFEVTRDQAKDLFS